jgi:pseudouridine-5'-phosphate glycosidase
VSELSGGASQRTNQALLVHNARTAGAIARELAALTRPSATASPRRSW